MPSPIEKMIDAAAKCAKCGAPMGGCSCWLALECPKCHRKQAVEREDYDPPRAVKVHIQCPECNAGDFDSPRYFDSEGKSVLDDPETYMPKG